MQRKSSSFTGESPMRRGSEYDGLGATFWRDRAAEDLAGEGASTIPLTCLIEINEISCYLL